MVLFLLCYVQFGRLSSILRRDQGTQSKRTDHQGNIHFSQGILERCVRRWYEQFTATYILSNVSIRLYTLVAIDLIKKLLTVDSDSRISTKEALQHTWMQVHTNLCECWFVYALSLRMPFCDRMMR